MPTVKPYTGEEVQSEPAQEVSEPVLEVQPEITADVPYVPVAPPVATPTLEIESSSFARRSSAL